MKAVIKVGALQYLVSKDDEILVDLVGDKKTLTLEPLLLFDDSNVEVGKPKVAGATVNAKVLEEVKGEKLKIMKFKAKKRVKTLTGHRQKYSKIKITSIVKK